MTYAALRSSPKKYKSRPPASNRAARAAWDALSREGARPIQSMGLLEGLWMCLLPDGTTDYVEASWARATTLAQKP